MMTHDMRVALRVAADYATHLHRDDSVPKRAAIAAAVRAVMRAHRTERSGLGEGDDKRKDAGAGPLVNTAILLSGVAAAGKLLGWIR